MRRDGKIMNNKILPCPICGRKPKSGYYGNRFSHGYKISCIEKGHTVEVYMGPHDSIFDAVWKAMNHDIFMDNCSKKVMKVVRKQVILEWNQRKI